MIELNGIYKLKHIKGLNSNTDYEYKVIGERFVFMIECLLDPEKPEDKYFGELIKK